MEKDQKIIYLYGDETKDDRLSDGSDFYKDFLSGHEEWVFNEQNGYTYSVCRVVDENLFQAFKRWIKRIIFKLRGEDKAYGKFK